MKKGFLAVALLCTLSINVQAQAKKPVGQPASKLPVSKPVNIAVSQPWKQLQTKERLVEIIVMSRNSPETGIRVLNSISHYNLIIT